MTGHDDPLLPAAARQIQRTVTDRTACELYHTLELPDGTLTEGQWDLRDGVAQYLGGVDVAGRSVLEVGPASGFISFYMESQGATVTAVEPPLDAFWDLVPRAGTDRELRKHAFRTRIEQVRNSFWYMHGLKQSRVRLFEANAYDLPADLGTFDCGVIAAVLLHCSSPVRLITSVSRRVATTLIITDLYFEELGADPICSLVPNVGNDTIDTWWAFTPAFIVNHVGCWIRTPESCAIHSSRAPPRSNGSRWWRVATETPRLVSTLTRRHPVAQASALP